MSLQTNRGEENITDDEEEANYKIRVNIGPNLGNESAAALQAKPSDTRTDKKKHSKQGR